MEGGLDWLSCVIVCIISTSLAVTIVTTQRCAWRQPGVIDLSFLFLRLSSVVLLLAAIFGIDLSLHIALLPSFSIESVVCFHFSHSFTIGYSSSSSGNTITTTRRSSSSLITITSTVFIFDVDTGGAVPLFVFLPLASIPWPVSPFLHADKRAWEHAS